MSRARRVYAAVVSGAVVVALCAAAVENLPHSVRLLRSQYAAYASYTRQQRDEALGALIPIRMDIFDFWRDRLHAGDRYYIQIPYEAFSVNGDKKYVVREIAHVYLLPAIETTNLADATVVLSWDDDPAKLHLHYTSEQRAGLQLIYVSRIDRGGG